MQNAGRRILLFSLFLSALASVFPVFSQVTLNIGNVPSEEGFVLVGFFATQADFDRAAAVREFKVKPADGKASLIVEDLPPGWYMVALYYDTNQNMELDRFMGIPLEAYAFSNNATGWIGPASFEDAKFYYDGKSLTLEIQL